MYLTNDVEDQNQMENVTQKLFLFKWTFCDLSNLQNCGTCTTLDAGEKKSNCNIRILVLNIARQEPGDNEAAFNVWKRWFTFGGGIRGSDRKLNMFL